MVKFGFGEWCIGKMLALPMGSVEGESARGCGIVTYQNQLKIRAFDGNRRIGTLDLAFKI
jgi:hypothetical protein